MNAIAWLLASTFEPRGSSLYTLRLASHLPTYGFQPIILCDSARQVPARLRKSLDIREYPRLMNRLLRPLAYSQILDELGDSPPQLVHAQRRNLAGIGYDLARRLRRPYLVTVHDFLEVGESLALHPDSLGALIAVSPSIERDLALGAGLPSEWLRVIPNGVELPEIPRLPELRSESRIPVVGTACALEAKKGLTYLLMAAELILSSGQDAEFLIAGSGPEEETLRKIARELDIANRVTFVGYVSEYTKILETVDVFVVPSLEQGIGTVMLEAMAMNKPVVATRTGGIADFLVDGEHALLVPPENHLALSEKIRFLLDNPDRARRLAVAGQTLVREHFSADLMTRRTVELYREVLARFHETLGSEPSIAPSPTLRH